MSKALEPQSLETYLAKIERELRALPAQARTEEMREIEAHLRALVLASQQLENLSQAQATEVGLRQFGSPRAIGRKLRKAWERKHPEAWWRAVLAPIAGLTFYAFDALIYNRVFDLINDCFGDILRRPWTPPMYLCFALWMLSTAFFTGFIVGVVSPKRGIWLTLIYCVYSIYGLSLLASAPEQANAFGWSVIQIVCLSLLINLICPLTALAGTYFGARRGRKVSARIENAGKKVFAHIAEGREFLARIAGDSKLNVQL